MFSSKIFVSYLMAGGQLGELKGFFHWLLKISLDLFQSNNSAILMGGLAGEFEE